MAKPTNKREKSSAADRDGGLEQAGTIGRRRQNAPQQSKAGSELSQADKRAQADSGSRDSAAPSASSRHPGGDAAHLYVVLSRAHQWISAHASHDIRKSGLNITEFGVLELLYHKGPQPLQQIGGKILMSSGNITYVIDKLESKGLVARRASPHDRRVSFAEVTEQGRVFMEEIFPQHRLALEEAVSGLSPEERAQAIELLKKLGLAAQRKAGNFT